MKLLSGRSTLILQFIALCLIAPCSQAFAGDGSAPALSLNDRVYIASRIYASLNNFAHWQNAPNLDVDAAYRAYLDKALASEDRRAFSLASMEFLAEFKNSHTLFIDMPLAKQGGVLPFIAESIHGQWVVTESLSPGLNPGDVIESIDGRPFAQFVADCSRWISASTEEGGRHLLFARMTIVTPYAHLFPERFELTLSGGRKVVIDRRTLHDASLETEGRWLEPGKVAYIRIHTFLGSDYEKRALELAKEYRQAKVLIVDVRGEPGGSTPTDLASFLMDRPSQFWTESTPVAMPYFRFRASQGKWEYQPFVRPSLVWSSPTASPAKDVFMGKLAILTDAGCYSACEDFVMPFKMNHRALIVGETTGGSTGNADMIDLGQGMMIMVGVQRVSFPDGTQFEGVGIKPDVEVTPTVEDLRAGKDTVLEVARRHLAD
ncbi:MAG: S41 family peptidase [Terracidiphilus sp.]